MALKSIPGDNMKLFCFGYSYTAEHLYMHMQERGINATVQATSTRPEKKERMKNNGIKTYLFDEHTPLADAPQALQDVTHILISIPPCGDIDPIFEYHADALKDLKNLKWVGYLSTTGVYGNRDGGVVTEECRLNPTSKRGSRRVSAEQNWLSLHEQYGLPVHIFRLSGIYGHGRSAIDSVLGGNARRIYKKGHVFNRIHVDDIAQVLLASMLTPAPGNIYNLADDMPAPSHEVITYACALLNRPPAPLLDFEEADLSPMARSFYCDHKIVDNSKIKKDLGITLKYPDYKSGLEACLRQENEARPALCINS